MRIFKAKAPFFSGSYYKELLKELKVIGIFFAAVQILYGIVGAFGRTGDMGILSLFAFGSRVLDFGAGFHADVYWLFFFVCGLNFISTHISRKNWDFRSSLPIAKRTMFACHFAAVLTFAVIIFAANYLGALIGEVIRLASTEFMHIPDGLGMSAVSMLKSVVSGVSIYCLIVLIYSVVVNPLSVLAVIGVLVGLPSLFMAYVTSLRDYGISTWELLFPLGISGLERFDTILSILAMILLAALAYYAFGKSRTETFLKPARTVWIHVLIGLGVAACVCIIAAFAFQSIRNGAYNRSDWVFCIILGLIPTFIAYFIYMWITAKNFEIAFKRCAFLPLVLVVFVVGAILAVIADNKWKKLDFSAANIDYIRITDNNYYSDGREMMFSSSLYFDSYMSPVRLKRGDSGAFSVKLRDEALIKKAAELAKLKRDEQDSGWVGIFADLYDGRRARTVEITLKDGTKWAIPAMDYEGNFISLTDAAANKDYIEKLASLDRFKHAKILYPRGLGSELCDTLLDELASLSALDRAAILGGYVITYDADELTANGKDLDYYSYGYTLTLTSPSYDHMAQIDLNGKLPKTRELYIKIMSERMKSHKDYNRFITGLKNVDFLGFHGNAVIMDGEGPNKLGFYFDTLHDFNSNAESKGEYMKYVKEISALIADCIENGGPIEGAEAVVGIEVSEFTVQSTSRMREFLFNRKMNLIFVGTTAEKAQKLESLIMEFYSKDFDRKGVDILEYSYGVEMETILKAVENGSIRLFDMNHKELKPDELLEQFYNGYEWFYVNDGEQMFITDIYEMLTDTASASPQG